MIQEADNDTGYDDLEDDLKAAYELQVALRCLHEAKPDDRSEKARRIQITITDMEKVIAYFDYYVTRNAAE